MNTTSSNLLHAQMGNALYRRNLLDIQKLLPHINWGDFLTKPAGEEVGSVIFYMMTDPEYTKERASRGDVLSLIIPTGYNPLVDQWLNHGLAHSPEFSGAILSRCALFDLRDGNGNNCCHHLVARTPRDIAYFNGLERYFTMKNDKGATPFHFLALKPPFYGSGSAGIFVEIAKLMISHGADWNDLSGDGQSAFGIFRDTLKNGSPTDSVIWDFFRSEEARLSKQFLAEGITGAARAHTTPRKL